MTIEARGKKRGEKTGRGEYGSWKKDFRRNGTVYLVFLPVFIYFLVMNYLPMFGIVMAFQRFKISTGFFRSEWVGLRNFIELFSGDTFPNAVRNTFIMAGFNLTLGFLAPVVFALLITSVKHHGFRRVCQTISYLPNFVAAMVVVNIVMQFLDVGGAITGLLTAMGFHEQNWLANPDPPVFWLINTLIGIWQGFGYGSIIFIAAITNISEEYYEAAAIDGAGSWQRMWRITIPCIMPMVIMMFMVQVGVVLKVGFDKTLLLYKPVTYGVADNMYTYTYRMAFGSAPDYSLAAASGLLQSIVGTIMLACSNWLSGRTTEMKLF